MNNEKVQKQSIILSLQKIAQMSDSGAPEKTIIEMKKIASDALKVYEKSKEKNSWH